MNEIVRNIITCLVVLLILLCCKRQRRYWREMQTSRLSGSLKVGYSLAIFAMGVMTPLALFYNNEQMWTVFLSVLLMTVVFCAKITFSPSIIAMTLGMSLYQLHTDGGFPFWEIWSSLVSVLTWRLPEDIRAAYATLSFVWVMLSLVSGPAVSATEDSAPVTGVDELISSLHT
jgi:hypothetical protein